MSHYDEQREAEITRKNSITEVRTPKVQDNFDDWELQIMKYCHSQNVTAEDLVHVLKNRSVATLKRKASQVG